MAVQLYGGAILIDGGAIALDPNCCCGVDPPETCCDVTGAVAATITGLPCLNGTYGLVVGDGSCADYYFATQINHCFTSPPVCVTYGGDKWYFAEFIVYVDVGHVGEVTGYVVLELWGYPSGGGCYPRTGVSRWRWDFERTDCSPGAMTLTATTVTGTNIGLAAPTLSWSDV